MRLQERFLHRILGVLCAAEQASRRREHARALAADEGGECRFVAGAQILDEWVGALSRPSLARASVEELRDVAGASFEHGATQSKRLQQFHARKIDERHAAQVEGEGRRRGEAPVGESCELGDGIAREAPLDEKAALGCGFQFGYSQHDLASVRGPCQGVGLV